MSRLTTYAYDLSGNIVEKNLGNGTTEIRSHDGRNRVSTLKNRTSGGADIAGYSYSYDRGKRGQASFLAPFFSRNWFVKGWSR